MAITKSTLLTSPDSTILSIVNNRANIADPRDIAGAGRRKFIYRKEPNHKSRDFSEFPYIILQRPSLTQERRGADGKSKYLLWTQQIIVRAVDSSRAGEANSLAHSQILAITDDLFETFNSETIKASLRGDGIYNLELIHISTSDPILEMQEVFEYEFELTYQTRMRVS